MRIPESKSIVRYLPVTPRDKAWGFYVTGAGMRDVPPHGNYYKDDSSRYKWKKGRVLQDYGMIYVAQGKGTFVTREIGKQVVSAGDLFVLFPGVWHNYRPHPDTGWVEYWILFNGAQPDRLFEHELIHPQSAVFHLSTEEIFENMFEEFLTVVETQPVMSNYIVSGMACQILANALSKTGSPNADTHGWDMEILQAKCYIEEHLRDSVDMEMLAASLNMSYRNFRRMFKQRTGLAPQQYQMQMRINHAKELLEDHHNRINEVALRVGFDDPFYFSRMFRKYAGISPSQWRETRGSMVF